MNYSDIPFPTLHRTDTMELPAIAGISIILFAIVLPFSSVFGIIVGIPGFAIALYGFAIGISNITKRFRWSCRFDARISAGKALKMISKSPSTFVLNVRYYSGGFDLTHLKPAIVLEDTIGRKLFAIYPTSWRIIERYENNGGRIVEC
jgi:hypothetical protein